MIITWKIPKEEDLYYDTINEKWYIYKIGYFFYTLLYGKCLDKTGSPEL